MLFVGFEITFCLQEGIPVGKRKQHRTETMNNLSLNDGWKRTKGLARDVTPRRRLQQEYDCVTFYIKLIVHLWSKQDMCIDADRSSII